MQTSALVLALIPAAALADPAAVPPSAPTTATATTGSETIVVIDRGRGSGAAPAARDRDRALGEAPFVTVVHADDHAATASVADAIGETVGTQTHALGGLGAYESVTVRGAPAGNTEVLVDGVPLARIASVTTDLGRFALGSFGQAELYRGTVPVELGGAGVGGALNLVTQLGPDADGHRVSAQAGYGSFEARDVRLHYGDAFAGGELLSALTVGYEGAKGNYTYFSDNGTPLNPNDDRYVTRTNDAFDQVDASARVGLADAPTNGGVRIAWKDQGLPGNAAEPTEAAALDTLDVVLDGHGQERVGRAVARQLGYLLVERQELRDPLGELGLGAQARDYLTFSGGATSTWLVPIARHRLIAGLELRGDRFTDADAHAARAALVGDREGGALLAAFDLVPDRAERFVITPAVRVELVRTAPTPSGEADTAPVQVRRDAIASPRISARAVVTGDLSLKASGGWYERLPTLVELFGDRGTIIGSPNLLPERGPSAEAGGVWAPARALAAVDRIMVEADGFWTRSHDTIALVPTAGFAVRAMNIADAQTFGAEAVASARFWRTLSVTANYTRLVTKQLVGDPEFDDKALPREPGHAIYARADVTRTAWHRRADAWVDANWQSTAYLDQANLQAVPGRVLLGIGARVELVHALGVSFSVANLANLRVQELPLVPPPSPTLTQAPTALADLQGYPLPGRAFYFSIDWSH